MIDLEELEDEELDELDIPSPAQKMRPEAIMGMIAGACALLLLVMVILCWPYMTAIDDPEAPQHLLQAAEIDEFLEPTISETEPEDPTVPPD